MQTTRGGRQNTAAIAQHVIHYVYISVRERKHDDWNCRTLLHMHTRTCVCGALVDLCAAPAPQAVPRRQCIRPPCSTFFPHICPSVGARVGPASGGVPVAPTGRVAMGDGVTDDPRRPSNDGLQSGPPNSGVAYAAEWRTCPSVGCCSATGCACAPSAPSLQTGMGFWSKRSGTWPHDWEARRAAG